MEKASEVKKREKEEMEKGKGVVLKLPTQQKLLGYCQSGKISQTVQRRARAHLQIQLQLLEVIIE